MGGLVGYLLCYGTLNDHNLHPCVDGCTPSALTLPAPGVAYSASMLVGLPMNIVVL